jgi:ATP-dependent Lon protease
MPGRGKISMTGKLGDVMKESAHAAMSFVRSRAISLDVASDFYQNFDFHLHVPEGAIPKDGPSAGVAMATAMVSVLTRTPVRADVAMTGEITLRGKVLPVGGIKEKVLAAHRAGIRTVILPARNERDVEDVPEDLRRQLAFIFVDDADEVLRHALVAAGAAVRSGA